MIQVLFNTCTREKKITRNAFKGPNLPFTYTETNKSIKDNSLNLEGKKKSRVKKECAIFVIRFWF